jgi:hypothetical protein
MRGFVRLICVPLLLIGVAGPGSRAAAAEEVGAPTPAELSALIEQRLAELEALGGEAAQTEAGLVFGQRYETIPTLDGWLVWVGWNASFSESYLPESESYAWIVYFAANGIYVGLASAESVYSSVDVNAGFDYFYGALAPPSGSTVTASYLDSLLGVTLSKNAFDWSPPALSPFGGLKAALTVGQTFFRVGSSTNLERGIQYSAGAVVAFELVPLPFPFGVSLETSASFIGFYPIVAWAPPADPDDNPNRRIAAGLQAVAATPGTTFLALHARELAGRLIPIMQGLPAHDRVADFVERVPGNAVEALIDDVGEWLDTGNTSELPEHLEPPYQPREAYSLLRPAYAATQVGFEMGYRHGYDASGRDDTVYADCIVRVACKLGEVCKLVVPASELVALVPGSSASDFEDLTVWFDEPVDAYLVSESTTMGVPLEGGKAVHAFFASADAPLFLGVAVEPEPATGDKRLELCRRAVSFAPEPAAGFGAGAVLAALAVLAHRRTRL